MRDYDRKERAWLWLSMAIGLNTALADMLVWQNGGIELLFDGALKGDIRTPENIKPSQKAMLLKLCWGKEIDELITALDRRGFHAVTRDSRDYPDLLREIYDPPLVLFVKGRLTAHPFLPIAVIGSRRCTDYGRGMAEYFGRELAKRGSCVVSGMADGCDSAAAWGALSVKTSDYPTVAVLGSGIDVIYPSGSRRLYDEIAERGAVVTEYALGTKAARENFPRRNRIISGMSRGVLVTEAAERSGTNITCGCAIDQGRDVFAVPGRLTDRMSAGTNLMIKRGEAKAVFDYDDIFIEYGIRFEEAKRPEKTQDAPGLSGDQKTVYETLERGERSADEICELTGLSASKVGAALTEMELTGVIKRNYDGTFSV